MYKDNLLIPRFLGPGLSQPVFCVSPPTLGTTLSDELVEDARALRGLDRCLQAHAVSHSSPVPGCASSAPVPVPVRDSDPPSFLSMGKVLCQTKDGLLPIDLHSTGADGRPKEKAAVIADNGSGMCNTEFAGDVGPQAGIPSIVEKPKMPGDDRVHAHGSCKVCAFGARDSAMCDPTREAARVHGDAVCSSKAAWRSEHRGGLDVLRRPEDERGSAECVPACENAGVPGDDVCSSTAAWRSSTASWRGDHRSGSSDLRRAEFKSRNSQNSLVLPNSLNSSNSHSCLVVALSSPSACTPLDDTARSARLPVARSVACSSGRCARAVGGASVVQARCGALCCVCG